MGHNTGYGGFNSVYGNGAYSGYDVNNLNTVTVDAHKNWWGTANPSSSQFNGPVDYNFWLTSPPAVPKVAGNATRAFLSPLANKTILVDSLKNAASTETKASDRSSALAHYYSLVRRDKNNILNEKSNVIPFLNTRLAQESVISVQNQIFVLLLDAYHRQAQYRQVLSAIAALPTGLSGDEIQASYIYGIFANVAIGDFAAASTLVQTYEKQFPKASELVFLKEYIADAQKAPSKTEAVEKNVVAEESKTEIEQERPANLLAMQTYPNPFNPSTNILFTLPHEGDVAIRIFNLLGDEVMIWTNLSRAAGNHTLFWDGRDKNGLEVGSGVYIYRLVYRSFENGAKQIVENRKMTLVR